MGFTGTNISVGIDGMRLIVVQDTTYSLGMAALGSGWHTAHFDSFVLTPQHVKHEAE